MPRNTSREILPQAGTYEPGGEPRESGPHASQPRRSRPNHPFVVERQGALQWADHWRRETATAEPCRNAGKPRPYEG